MQAKYHIVSIQLEVDRVFLTPFQGSTLSDFRKRQNEFLTSEKNVGINFWSSKSQTGSKTCFFKFIKPRHPWTRTYNSISRALFRNVGMDFWL